jgi:hypothetical protein
MVLMMRPQPRAIQKTGRGRRMSLRARINRMLARASSEDVAAAAPRQNIVQGERADTEAAIFEGAALHQGEREENKGSQGLFGGRSFSTAATCRAETETHSLLCLLLFFLRQYQKTSLPLAQK